MQVNFISRILFIFSSIEYLATDLSHDLILRELQKKTTVSIKKKPRQKTRPLMCRTVTHSTKREKEREKIFRKIKITPLSLIKGKMITIIDDYNYCHLITRRRRRRCPFGNPLSERAVVAVEDLAWIPRLLSIKTTRAADQCVCECVFV